MRVTIVGGGLAGCEAAWQLARRGIGVDLHEMRPVEPTPVHQTGDLAELVCSNSLRGNALDQAAGPPQGGDAADGLADHARRRRGARCPPAARWRWTAALFAQRVTGGGRRAARGHAPPRRGAPHPRTTWSRSWPRARSPRRRWRPRSRRFVGQDHLLLLRRGQPGGGGRQHRLRRDVQGLALRQGRRRLRELPARPRRSTAAFYDALTDRRVRRRVHDFEHEFFFEGCLPVEVIASRGPETLLLRAR